MFIKDTYDVLVKLSFFLFELNRIGNVMVGVLASKAVDRGFEASVGSKQTLSNWYYFFAKHAACWSGTKRTSSSYSKLTYSHQDIAENC
jgi:hypothetical protein